MRAKQVEAVKGLTVERLHELRKQDRRAGAPGAVGPKWQYAGPRVVEYRESDVDEWIESEAQRTRESLAKRSD